jgi:DNA-binding IclR family transcriptional regulator
MPTSTPINLDEALVAFMSLLEERGPTVRELQEALELSSTSMALRRLQVMVHEGLIESDPWGSSRGYRPTAAGRARFETLKAVAR